MKGNTYVKPQLASIVLRPEERLATCKLQDTLALLTPGTPEYDQTLEWISMLSNPGDS